MDLSYWQKQTSSKPLFSDIEWNKPERRDQAGRLGIVGGNKLGFASIADSYSLALNLGVGEVRILLPDALKSNIPKNITDTIYSVSTPSGSLATEASNDLQAIGNWADSLLMIGDAGRNSETAVLYEKFIENCQKPLTISRDAVDLVKNSPRIIVERPNTMIVASFAQLQKLFQGVYYPKILTFSMQLLQLVEALHKFTITYPCTVVVFHKDNLIIASGGRVITQDFTDPMKIWRGEIATKIASYWLWNPAKPLESATSAIFPK
ncbi:hypothetical protein CR956_01365 [Candidatus Saccharibacteria bacterium]|nr:MAG: hypothetical protein CR956_01365 [Candidatus Saccharibacteria bacterium]